MSRVYRRPLATFYLPERPSTLGFAVPHDFRRLAQEERSVLSPELITELRRIEYLRDAAIEFAEETPQESRRFIGTSQLGEPVEAVAERAIGFLSLPLQDRVKWDSEYDALNGWRDAIERQGVLVMHLNHVEVSEIRGVAIAEPVFPLIAVNGKDSPNGRIFTLVHEFVHLMLGATGMSNMRLARRPVTLEQRLEQYCNRVTGEILVPRQALLKHGEPAGESANGAKGDETILVVEDERAVRRLIVSTLQEHGYATLDASTPSEALAMALAGKGPIDLLVTDMVMPEMNGADLARRIKAVRKSIRTLFITGYVSEETRRNVRNVLAKPFSPVELAIRVRKTLDQRPARRKQ